MKLNDQRLGLVLIGRKKKPHPLNIFLVIYVSWWWAICWKYSVRAKWCKYADVFLNGWVMSQVNCKGLYSSLSVNYWPEQEYFNRKQNLHLTLKSNMPLHSSIALCPFFWEYFVSSISLLQMNKWFNHMRSPSR